MEYECKRPSADRDDFGGWVAEAEGRACDGHEHWLPGPRWTPEVLQQVWVSPRKAEESRCQAWVTASGRTMSRDGQTAPSADVHQASGPLFQGVTVLPTPGSARASQETVR